MAQNYLEPPLLTFTQTQTVSVKPNTAVIRIELRKSFEQVGNTRLLDFFTELEINNRLLGIEKRSVELFPTFADSAGYVKRAVISVNDLSKIEPYLLLLKQRNVHVTSTQFLYSNLNQLKQQAYLEGIKVAKIRAQELSSALSAVLGKVYSIKESKFEIDNYANNTIQQSDYLSSPLELNIVLELEDSYLLN